MPGMKFPGKLPLNQSVVAFKQACRGVLPPVAIRTDWNDGSTLGGTGTFRRFDIYQERSWRKALFTNLRPGVIAQRKCVPPPTAEAPELRDAGTELPFGRSANETDARADATFHVSTSSRLPITITAQTSEPGAPEMPPARLGQVGSKSTPFVIAFRKAFV